MGVRRLAKESHWEVGGSGILDWDVRRLDLLVSEGMLEDVFLKVFH